MTSIRKAKKHAKAFAEQSGIPFHKDQIIKNNRIVEEPVEMVLIPEITFETLQLTGISHDLTGIKGDVTNINKTRGPNFMLCSDFTFERDQILGKLSALTYSIPTCWLKPATPEIK